MPLLYGIEANNGRVKIDDRFSDLAQKVPKWLYSL